MARRLAVLPLAACLSLGAAACGGDEAPTVATTTPEPAAATEREAAAATREREPARAGAEAKAQERPAEPAEPRPEPRDRARSDPEATLERVKDVVGTVVSLISAGDPGVCRAYFTQRYADLVSGLKGERAFRRCESDIEQNKGPLRVTAFGPSSIRDTRAVVKFNLEVAGTRSSQEWRLVFSDGRWRVDDSG